MDGLWSIHTDQSDSLRLPPVVDDYGVAVHDSLDDGLITGEGRRAGEEELEAEESKEERLSSVRDHWMTLIIIISSATWTKDTWCCSSRNHWTMCKMEYPWRDLLAVISRVNATIPCVASGFPLKTRSYSRAVIV